MAISSCNSGVLSMEINESIFTVIKMYRPNLRVVTKKKTITIRRTTSWYNINVIKLWSCCPVLGMDRNAMERSSGSS